MSDTAVVLAFQTQQARIRERVERLILDLWQRLPAYDEENVAQFVAGASRVVPASQVAMARLVDAYVARLAQDRPVGVPREVATNARGVRLAEEYRRPFIEAWSKLSEGTQYTDAVKIGGQRAVKLAATDTQLAMRASMNHIVDHKPRIVGYRRVLTGKSCVFCASAATRRYHKEVLMPLHSHCDCGVAPIIGHRDPGAVANQELLDKLKAQGPSYWKRRGFVSPDGSPVDPTAIPEELGRVGVADELGPVLLAA